MNDPKPSGAASFPIVPLPRLVLRVAFAGNRDLPSGEALQKITVSLEKVWNTLSEALRRITHPEDGERRPPVATFYESWRPLLRLVTGLAEGGDTLAWQTLRNLPTHGRPPDKRVIAELAAVLPSSLEEYRAGREASHRAAFDKQAAECAYIMELDGVTAKSSIDSETDKARRHRAYRAQGTILLRHADVLVALATPDTGKAGGTVETVRKALAFDLPVVFISAGTGGENKGAGEVRLLDPDCEMDAALSDQAPANWEQTLTAWIRTIVADPDIASKPAPVEDGKDTENEGQKLLAEFFFNDRMPPASLSRKRMPRPSGRYWKWFYDCFKSSEPRPSRGKRIWKWLVQCGEETTATNSPGTGNPFDEWRNRARVLNYYYTGFYRDTFLVNYARAVLAVACATTTLVLLGFPAAHPPKGPLWWMISLLLVLALTKFILVFRIYKSTHQANHLHCNEGAVDYRYLMERLRSMKYLPQAGSFQPPAAAEPHYTSRAVRQSAVDWLFDAIVRDLSPAHFAPEGHRTITLADDSKWTKPVIRVDSEAALASLKKWISGQGEYHADTSQKMDALHAWSQKWVSRMGKTVIGIVAFDIAVLVAFALGLLPDSLHHILHSAAPWLVLITALLPAAVASLNGLRFQSECRRLADRSTFMHSLLLGRKDSKNSQGRLQQVEALAAEIAKARGQPATDPGAWSAPVLLHMERVARDLVRETSEWTALYSKEIPEP